jgi:L-alanine-DL-glutamate epimerase-like enolase superfamily enzyme
MAAKSIQDAILLDPFTVSEGTVGLPSAPGLGVRLTPEIVARFSFKPDSGERT